MAKKRPFALSFAGFDPSGGAGLLADIKTMEAQKVYGLGVCTALTFQNDETFQSLEWVPLEKIQQQADLLFEKFTIDFVKVGLIESWEVLEKLLVYLKEKNPNIKVILDPILKASAGFSFHEHNAWEKLEPIFNQLYLVTPNWEEIQQLLPDQSPIGGAKQIAQHCAVFLKGGHNEAEPGRDYLFVQDNIYPFQPKIKDVAAKHGSGCVFSSALVANLAKGYRLQKACLKAKKYTTRFLKSNDSLLGYHKI